MTDKQTLDILKSKDEGRLCALACDPGADPEALFVLSQSGFSKVRAGVADNLATPHQADQLLLDDEDEAVTTGLARKVAGRAAEDPAQVSQADRGNALVILQRMIDDQNKRIRRIIAQEIKASPFISKEVVMTLVNDDEFEVCGPVLQYSPLLDDPELISIISRQTKGPALEAIANRASVSEPVADSLADTMDKGAVAALLRNDNAQIREDTLDRIVDKARDVEAWHAPLVKRPKLSLIAIQRICDFVSAHLLDDLGKRDDVDDTTHQLIKDKLEARIAEENTELNDSGVAKEAIERDLEEKKNNGLLTPEFVWLALENEELGIVWPALALLSEIEQGIIHRIFASRSAKAITALCHRAELPMWLARELQERAGKIKPDDCLAPTADNEYPLKPDELDWHLALFVDEEEAPNENADAA